MAEYENSDAAVAADALAAYEAGYRGEGVTLAVVDTGINPDLADFAGRIHPQSKDIVSTRGVSDEDGHGTAVTAVAAAAADGRDMLGVAPEATIASFRIDYEGSCASADGCEFYDVDIASGVDWAVTAGARVINLSLGGEAMSRVLIDAMQRAADRGIVFVIAAGNEGDTATGGNPDGFALDAVNEITGGTIIIAGSIGASGNALAISDFSNRAGVAADYYLAARGYRVQAPDHTGDQFLWSGTSFSAPAITGAVALLADAFPNLTGAEIVEILFDSAADLGASGVDEVFGHGALDIAVAIAPRGTTSVAGTTTAVSLTENGQLPAAAGDAAQRAMSTIITDRYDRAYEFNAAKTLRSSDQRQPLHQALAGTQLRGSALDLGPVAFTVSVDPGSSRRVDFGPLFKTMGNVDRDQARLIAGSVIARLDDKTKAAFGFSESAATLGKRLSGGESDAFMIAEDGLADNGFVASRDHSIAVRRKFGGTGVTLSSESGTRWTRLAEDGEQAHYRLDGVTVDRPLLGGQVRLGVSLLDEKETLLGGRLSLALGDDGSGAQTRFVDLSLRRPLGAGVTLGMSARRGWTDFGGGDFRTGAYAVDLTRSDNFTNGDRLAFRLSQPLRIESGGLNLYLPQSFDYATETATMDWQRFSLTPTGRELVGEVAYGVGALGGRIEGNAYLRRQPGHFAAASDDVGAAIRFTLGY